MKKTRVKFWGVRGSMAVPGKSSLEMGGNTSCVEISCGDDMIICDAGTGIRELGNTLIRQKKHPIKAHILLSHVHWDHYIGLPFFKPLYNSDNSFVIGGPKPEHYDFGEAISHAMRPPFFPIPTDAIPAKIRFKTISEKRFIIGKVKVVPIFVNHPGGAFGWRFDLPDGKKIAHITDNEPDGSKSFTKIVKWLSGVDVLIHDAQYLPSEYSKRKSWGHSPFTYPVEITKAANVKNLYLFHFDPDSNDLKLKRELVSARKYSKKIGSSTKVKLAIEGKTFEL